MANYNLLFLDFSGGGQISIAVNPNFHSLPSCSSSCVALFTVETLSQPKSSCDFIWLPQLTMLPLKNSSQNKATLTSTQTHTHTPHYGTLALFYSFSAFLTLNFSLPQCIPPNVQKVFKLYICCKTSKQNLNTKLAVSQSVMCALPGLWLPIIFLHASQQNTGTLKHALI